MFLRKLEINKKKRVRAFKILYAKKKRFNLFCKLIFFFREQAFTLYSLIIYTITKIFNYSLHHLSLVINVHKHTYICMLH